MLLLCPCMAMNEEGAGDSGRLQVVFENEGEDGVDRGPTAVLGLNIIVFLSSSGRGETEDVERDQG